MLQDRLPKVVAPLEAKPLAFGDQRGPLNLVLTDLDFENFNEKNLSLETFTMDRTENVGMV